MFRSLVRKWPDIIVMAGYPEIQQTDIRNPDFQKSGYPDLRIPGNSESRIPGFPEFRHAESRYSEIPRNPENPNVQRFAITDLCVLSVTRESPDLSISRFLRIWCISKGLVQMESFPRRWQGIKPACNNTLCKAQGCRSYRYWTF